MSNRFLTFSLTSLILIFGLATIPVMAHNPTTGAADPSHDTHPILVDRVDDTTTQNINEAVTAHIGHPMVTSITLKGDNTRGTMAAVTDPSVQEEKLLTLNLPWSLLSTKH